VGRAPKLKRIQRIRNSAVRLIRDRGQWHWLGTERLIGLDIGAISLLYRTPFQTLPTQTDRLRYARAPFGKKPNLPYGLDIWLDHNKVLDLEWDAGDWIVLIVYQPGAWEDELDQA
jgi:hypothetical protein